MESTAIPEPAILGRLVVTIVVTSALVAAAAYFATAVRTFVRPRTLVSTLAAVASLALVPTAGAHDVHLSFDLRSVSARAWEGTVARDLSGSVRMRVRSRDVSGERWRVRTAWAVDAGDQSFTARLRGVLNVGTRRVRLAGSVVSGPLAGAEAHVRGRIANLRNHRLVGTLTVLPNHGRAAAATDASSARACGDPCVSVHVVRHGDGLVTSTFGSVHGAIDCGTVCSAIFQSWTEKTIVLTATGGAFSHWKDCAMPDGNRCLVDFDVASRFPCVHAFFTPDENAPASAGACPVVEPPKLCTEDCEVPPNTRIVAGPRARTTRRVATFRFASTAAGSTFRCRLDARAWTSCASPKTYRNLAPGRHVFRVVALDGAGNADPTPALRSWRVVAG